MGWNASLWVKSRNEFGMQSFVYFLVRVADKDRNNL